MSKPQTTNEKTKLYEIIQPLFAAMHKEISLLSAKKHEGALNQTKIKMINQLLEDVLSIVKDEEGIKYLSVLDGDMVPTYSDVAIILSQFETALKKFKQRYYRREDFGPDYWDVVDPDESDEDEDDENEDESDEDDEESYDEDDDDES